MPDARSDKAENRLTTIDIWRRDYGRRYTALPVDSLDHQGFMIDCTEAYTRPAMFDVREGDTVLWLSNGRYIQATIVHVERTSTLLRAVLEDTEELPPDFFPY
jgi:hypothetical protein